MQMFIAWREYTPGMADNCIFGDNPAGNREHLWAQWIHERHDFGPIRMQRGSKEEIIVPDPKITVKSVCAKCNNGWMNDLENANIPLLGSMMQDLSLRLEPDQQITVGRWVTKTGMILDSIRPRTNGIRFYTQDECAGMRTGLVIPARTRIWLGRMPSKHLHAGGTDFLYRRKEDGKPIVHSSINSFVVGYFVAQIMTQHTLDGFDEHTIPDLEPKPGDWENQLLQIWPVERERIMWPPPVSFTNGGALGIGYLLDRFRIGDNVEKVEPLKP
jgi:hypothetical protein